VRLRGAPPVNSSHTNAMFCRVILLIALAAGADASKKHHHHHHHHHHTKPAPAEPDAAAAPSAAPAAGDAAHTLVDASAKKADTAVAASVNSTEAAIMSKMKELEAKMGSEAANAAEGVKEGRIIVNGPLPTDFAKVFQNAVAEATGCDPNVVVVKESHPVAVSSFIQLRNAKNAGKLEAKDVGGEVEVVFDAPADVVDAVQKQAADAESKLVNGQLHNFLVADDSSGSTPAAAEPPAAAPSKSVDIDTEMPYGELEPFGREDTAQELTDQSIQESDEMVDQLERAEVAEEKRSVFRALTRLRGAAITSFDGIARSQTGNIDEYNHVHKWRQTHPLHHLADEESDVSKWAFPDNAD